MARICEVPSDEYFRRRGLALDPLDLPDCTARLISAVRLMPRERRNQVLRAAYWYDIAYKVWDVSKSLYYNCLVSAIETLMTLAAADPCPECGRNRGPGPTAAFKEFVERYAPGPHTAKQRAALYGLRSALSHGHKLLRGDLPTAWGLLHPTQIEEWDMGGDVAQIARIGLVNWVFEMARVAGT